MKFLKYFNLIQWNVAISGFLSGLTAAEAIFAFNFANEDLLMHGYRYMSLPVHAVFLACFTVGFVSGLDRFEYFQKSKSPLAILDYRPSASPLKVSGRSSQTLV